MTTQKISVILKGQSPLLMHAFPMVPIEAIEKKTPEEQAEIAAYRDPDTKGLYIPSVCVQRALVAAAIYSKGKGRGSLQQVTAACVFVNPERISLGTDKFVVDSRPVVIAATKGRIMRHRPRLDQWEISFEIEFDGTLLTEKQVRQIVDNMGSRIGLLDFRPQKKGPFGRCIVVKWESKE